MSKQNPAPVSGAIGQSVTAAGPSSSAPLCVAGCCLAIIFALVLGVGLASNLVLRHIVQTVPFWIGVVLGFRRSRAATWVGLPLFLFWLVLMALIWAYLLGISHLVSGHFSPIEIAMTIIVGAASIIGIACFVAFKSCLSLAARLSSFVALTAIQWVCFRLSFLPAIAHR
jgi:hypothetical protein